MKKFIAMWDNTGLECLIDFSKHEKEVDAWEKKKAWNILKELPLNETNQLLVSQAKQFNNFEDFSKAISVNGLKPRVWHITKDSNFKPDVNYKPLDRTGRQAENVLYAGSPKYWESYASSRDIAVEYDITNLELNKDYYIDASGNEGIVILPNAYSKLKEISRTSVADAKKKADKQYAETAYRDWETIGRAHV